MISRDQVPILCCGIYKDFGKMLVSREIGWRDWCPKNERDKWVMFHAACAPWFGEVQGKAYDSQLQKMDVLYMVHDLKKHDKYLKHHPHSL